MNATAQPAKQAETHMYVRDMTATLASGARTHEMMVNGAVEAFEFKPGKSVKLDRAVAVKFLMHGPQAFRLCDKDGVFIDWKGTPRQPGDLQAGERLRIDADQTVAYLNELTDEALWLRCAALPGGEAVADGSRDGMISFIVESVQKRRRENSQSDRSEDEFVPEVDMADIDA
jgi:hypothetical protein